MFTVQDQIPSSIEDNTGDQPEDDGWVINYIFNAEVAPPGLSTAKIHRVPDLIRESTHEFEKYYVPQVVSIGPYHFGEPKLQFVEKLKPVFALKLLERNEEILRSLYKKLGDPNMVQELRSFYEVNETIQYSNKQFTVMMLLDSCFILYYIKFIFGMKAEASCELSIHQIVYLHQDLFLLENQIPFKVLNEVMKLLNLDSWVEMFKWFISDNIFEKILCIKNNGSSLSKQKIEFIHNVPDHLLHLLHRTLTKNERVFHSLNSALNFRNVSELVDVGIHFKPSKDESLVDIKFLKGWWWFSADLELPPIIVDDSTKPLFLNLIAYEMCSGDASLAWVTSYICLLDSLIRHPEDVEILRKAGVLHDYLGRDQEVVRLFNEIATGLVPNSNAYLSAKKELAKHYKIWSYTLTSQIKHQYLRNPGVFFSYFGVVSLFLSGVQTYFTIWSPKSK